MAIPEANTLVTLYRLSRLHLGTHVYTLTHICIQQQLLQRRGHEFERDHGGVYERVWREGRDVVITFSQKAHHYMCITSDIHGSTSAV